MENLKKLLSFLAPLPPWFRVVIVALVTVIVSVCLLISACTVVSCGITQSTVNNFNSDNNTIEMGVTPSTTTSTTASPTLNFPN